MQCQYDTGLLPLPDYPLDYPLDYELESCEDIILEDLSSAADCADLCYDDWDCADWHFDEDEMQCVHELFVCTIFFECNPEVS